MALVKASHASHLCTISRSELLRPGVATFSGASFSGRLVNLASISRQVSFTACRGLQLAHGSTRSLRDR